MPVRRRMPRVAPAAAAIAVMLSTVGLGGSPSMMCSPMLSRSNPRPSASAANWAMAPKSSGMAVPKLRLSGCVMTPTFHGLRGDAGEPYYTPPRCPLTSGYGLPAPWASSGARGLL